MLPLPQFADGFELAGWHIVHGDQPIADTHAVMGHWHPAVRRNGRKVPCFLARGGQIVLPAFSLDAAGVEVRDDPRWRGWNRYAIVGNDVIAMR
jgi:metallophosphoesterase superfamily enzyme